MKSNRSVLYYSCYSTPIIAENLPLVVLDLTGRNGGRKEIGRFFFLDNESIIYPLKYPTAVCDKDAKTLEVNLIQYFFSLIFLQENFINQFCDFWPLGE